MRVQFAVCNLWLGAAADVDQKMNAAPRVYLF